MRTVIKPMPVLMMLCTVLLAASTLYAGNEGVKLGSLEIKAIPGTRHNLIIKSSVDVDAVFTDSKGNKEYYVGEMGNKLGLDFSFKTDENLVYAVISASSNYKTGGYALEGKYFGQKASVALDVGGEVQVLVGGFEKSFTLQPFAVGEVEGYGVSLGLGYLNLQKDPRK